MPQRPDPELKPTSRGTVESVSPETVESTTEETRPDLDAPDRSRAIAAADPALRAAERREGHG